MEKPLIKMRIDVDYPYPSRIRSSLYTAFGVRAGKDYLQNSKILARMINESQREIMAYWFFTPKTIPDRALLELLRKDRHEVALHIANEPYKELEMLEQATGRKVRYYTIHGTARLIARIMWKRWRAKAPKIPENYRLQSFHQFPTLGLDVLCHVSTPEQALKIATKHIEKADVIHIHPIWLFQRGRINYRGPYFCTLRKILQVDSEFGTLFIRKKLFFKVARNSRDYETDANPAKEFLELLKGAGADIFTFLERRWTKPIANPSSVWVKARDNIALLQITSYDQWLASVGKKTRNMIRKAEKRGISTDVTELGERFAKGVRVIYNETPIRQERVFPHYNSSLHEVTRILSSVPDCTYIGAYFQNELAGFIQLVHGKNIEIISQILSLQKHWDKAVNNALLAKAVEFCARKGAKWIMYGRMGNHLSLDDFKQSNGFAKYELARYFIPLTRKGRIAVKLGLHRSIQDRLDDLPMKVKYPLLGLYSRISKIRAKFKFRNGPKAID